MNMFFIAVCLFAVEIFRLWTDIREKEKYCEKEKYYLLKEFEFSTWMAMSRHLHDEAVEHLEAGDQELFNRALNDSKECLEIITKEIKKCGAG